jgi:hypothetical protein
LDHRGCPRYLLRAPVVFRWTKGASAVEQGAGFAWDVSVNGLYVVCHRPCPPTGAEVCIELLLDVPTAPKNIVRLQATGRVVRQANPGEGDGFAVAANLAWANDRSVEMAVTGRT